MVSFGMRPLSQHGLRSRIHLSQIPAIEHNSLLLPCIVVASTVKQVGAVLLSNHETHALSVSYTTLVSHRTLCCSIHGRGGPLGWVEPHKATPRIRKHEPRSGTYTQMDFPDRATKSVYVLYCIWWLGTSGPNRIDSVVRLVACLPQEEGKQTKGLSLETCK